MNECTFKDLIKTECTISGPKRKVPYALDDFTDEQWKEKLWLAGKKNPTNVPTNITICRQHNEYLRCKFRNKLCCNPLQAHGKNHKCVAG